MASAKTDLAYLAGFFDGEGYVGVVFGMAAGQHTLRVTVTNNYRPTLTRYRDRWGGSVRNPSISESGNGGKLAWTWQATGHEAIVFLKAILPYLDCKKPQATLAISFPMGQRGKRVSPADYRRRATLDRRLKQMKRAVRTVGPQENDPLRIAELEDRKDVQRAIELYRSGLTIAAVADKIGAKPATVNYWLLNLGVTRTMKEAQEIRAKNRAPITDRPEVAKAVKLYRGGMSAWAVAREIGFKPATVNYWLRQLGETRTLAESQQLRRDSEKE